MVYLAIAFPSKVGFGICLTIAFLSDVFDGIIARRLGVATANLRRLDSITDTAFYLAACFAAWHLYPDAILSRVRPIAALILLEVTRYAFDWLKFRREASYHMWSSKLWGIGLFVGFFSLLALGSDNWSMSLAVYLGILSDCEGLAISISLRKWTPDVPSLIHALRTI
jgi:phosphatidylglycerophosphate synthase